MEVGKKLLALSRYETYSDEYYFDREIISATLARQRVLAERSFIEGVDILRIVGALMDKSQPRGRRMNRHLDTSH